LQDANCFRMDTVVSGIRSTGQLHLGNYFGAVKNFLVMQHTHRCFFFIADYHALTTHPDPQGLRQSVKQVIAEYLAAGLDPEACTLYVQSDIPQIPELYLLLNMHAYVGELERVSTFKDKVRKQPDNVNAGLLTYPVLMAADILIHRAQWVPVGKDQEQHLEMARNFAGRYNRMYASDIEEGFFPEPQPFTFTGTLTKIPGLDGSGKMGKSESEGNAIFLAEDPASIRKKVMRALTDSGPTAENQTPPQEIENLFYLLSVVSTEEVVNHFRASYANMTIRYGDLKKQLAEDVIAFTTPIAERIKDYLTNEALLEKVLSQGAEKARQSAQTTIEAVRERMGVSPKMR